MHAKEIDKFYQLPLIKIVLLLAIVTGAQGSLTRTPLDSVVLKGKSIVFTCCSDIQKTLFWKHKPVGSQDAKDINDLNGLVNGFGESGRFSVISDSSPGCHSLTITNVSRGDEGTYSCTDNAGLGQWKGWELVMLESFDCQEKNRKAEYMGVNDFGLPQDVIFMVCISKHFGNMRPKPICEWSSGAQLLDNYHHVIETNLTTTLNIQMPARKEFNGGQLFCYIKIDGRSSDKQTTTAWKSSHLIINYASFHQRGVSECSVDELSLECHPPCDYKTIQFNNGSSYCEIAYPNKTHQKLYVLLKDDNLPRKTNIHSSTNKPVESQTIPSRTATIIWTSVIAGFISAGVILTVFLIYWCCKKKRKRQSKEMNKMRETDVCSGIGDDNIEETASILTPTTVQAGRSMSWDSGVCTPECLIASSMIIKRPSDDRRCIHSDTSNISRLTTSVITM